MGVVKFSRFVSRYAGLPCLIFVMLIESAPAGTPGTCDDTAATRCGSGGTCVVNVSETTGPNPVTTVDKGAILVKSGTKIKWKSRGNSSFTVTFGASHPFSAATHGTFNGTPGHSAGDTATIPLSSSSVCYQYSVEHCINHRCANVDPKVIVTNVRGGS
jgi:hypothetical protein